jgi:hypothetical protein
MSTHTETITTTIEVPKLNSVWSVNSGFSRRRVVAVDPDIDQVVYAPIYRSGPGGAWEEHHVTYQVSLRQWFNVHTPVVEPVKAHVKDLRVNGKWPFQTSSVSASVGWLLHSCGLQRFDGHATISRTWPYIVDIEGDGTYIANDDGMEWLRNSPDHEVVES